MLTDVDNTSNHNQMQKQFDVYSRGIHLTFKGHHGDQEKFLKEKIISQLTAACLPLLFFSVVYENGHGTKDSDKEIDEEDSTSDGRCRSNDSAIGTGDITNINGYPHTHVGLWWKNSARLRGANRFDFECEGEKIHPHWKGIKTLKHFQRIYHEYHRKEPVALYQSVREPPPIGTSVTSVMVEAACGALTLREAVVAVGVERFSVSDIRLLREERDPPDFASVRYPASSFNLSINRDWTTLFVYGPSRMGKTEWAISQFSRPLLVRSVDDLYFASAKVGDDLRYDGLVIDDVSFFSASPESCIMLCEHERDSSVRIRYRNATIPAGLRRIFCSNRSPHDYFGFGRPEFTDDQKQAVLARIQTCHVLAPTFTKGNSVLSERVLSEGYGTIEGRRIENIQGSVSDQESNADDCSTSCLGLRRERSHSLGSGDPDTSGSDTQEAQENPGVGLGGLFGLRTGGVGTGFGPGVGLGLGVLRENLQEDAQIEDFLDEWAELFPIDTSDNLFN